MNTIDAINDLNRREFIKGGSFTTAMLMLGAVPLRAEDKAETKPPAGPPVNIGVIGCGFWSRTILDTLAPARKPNALPNAQVVALCDHYEAFLNRAAKSAPNAETYSDYTKLLANKDVKAVIVATPSHLHKQVVLDALASGKHVYCEAPLATTLEDSRAIAQAAQKAVKQYFQVGLLSRSDPEMHHVLPFFRTGAIGKLIKGRGQWHKKESWRRASPNPDREKELNWRLDQGLSLGLIGEIGVHQVDVASWLCHANPVAVTGFSSLVKWDDGREVPDSVQALFEYPDHVPFNYEVTLGNSFDEVCDIYYGTDATVMMRDGRAWMFKEVDSPLNGWEIYAQKNTFYKQSGISLLANASKQADLVDLKMTDPRPGDQGQLYYALEAFVKNTGLVHSAAEDFTTNFGGDDLENMKTFIAEQMKVSLHAAGAKEGHEAAVAVIKANEAIVNRQRIAFAKEWFAV